ncbi:phage tail tape measure protein [Lysobacter cavernae]|uniref:Phage tail tape measure protein n=1 Tax=Lysobacter cavernae TaxID=1685901 RepID=A0ABV7RKZ2_9GAMM
MAGNNLKLQVLLSAIDRASGPLKRIMGGSSAATKALRSAQSELKRLDGAQRDITGFRKLESQLGSTSNQLVQAQRELRRLGIEVNAAETPSKKLTAALKKQGEAVARLRELESRQRATLAGSRQALEAAGISTSRLAVHERQLQTDIAAANRAIDTQKGKLGKLAAAQAKMQRLHSAGMKVAAHGAGAVIGGGAVVAQAANQMQPAVDFESRMRDISITGGFSREQEAILGAQVRADAKRWGQFTDVISDGLGVLVANGISSSSDLAYYSGLLSKSSVATGAEMQDLGSLVVTLQKNLGIAKEGVGGALDSMAYAGKQGSFELRDMARWMPKLTPMMTALGVTGRTAVDELGAALQVARLGAGDSDEAANNLRNYLTKLTSPDTIKDFDKAGIDLKTRLLELQAQGISPLQGSLQLITEYMGKKGPEATRKLQQAMALKDNEQRQAALEQLASAYALGALFQDAQAMAFVRPALTNGGKLASIQQGAGSASGGINADWAARMDTGQKQIDQFNIRLQELKLKAGAMLLPTLEQLAKTAGGFLDRIGGFAERHPVLAAGLLKVAIAGAALIAALGGLLVIGGTTAMMIGNIINVVALLTGGTGFAGLLANVGKLARPLIGLGGRILPLVATAIRMVGMAVIANPIAAVLMLLAGIGYLIYRNWGTIGPMLAGIWESITIYARQAWDGLKGIVVGAWNGVLGFLGGLWTRFQAIGGQLMQGLVNGLLGGLKAVGDTITSIGGKVVDWFKGKLGIHSPSRVFAQLGGYTMDGLAGGLQRGQSAPLRQIDSLGQRMKQAGAGLAIAAAAAPAAAIDNRAPITAASAAPVAAGNTYHITINAAAGAPAQDIATLVRLELERIEREKGARTRSRLGDYD